jgi:hypothetical protein
MLFIRLRERSVFWHCAPSEYAVYTSEARDEVVFLTLCRQKTDAFVAVAFERMAQPLCPDCREQYIEVKPALARLHYMQHSSTPIDVQLTKGE